MAPGQSTLRRTREEIEAMESKKAELGVPPAIDFWTSMSKTDKEEAEEAAEVKYKKNLFTTISVPLAVDSSTKDKHTYERYVKTFKGGTAEEFCTYMDTVHELFDKLGYDQYFEHRRGQSNNDDEDDEETQAQPTGRRIWKDCYGAEVAEKNKEKKSTEKKVNLLTSTMGGRALQVFRTNLERWKKETYPDPDDDSVEPAQIQYTLKEAYDYTLNELSKLYFAHPKDAVKTQKRYLREGGLTFSGEYSSPNVFWERLNHINQLLTYFPWTERANGTVIRPVLLEDDELIEILDKARSDPVRKVMLQIGDHSRKYDSPTMYANVLEQWHDNVLLTQALDKRNRSKEETSRKRKKDKNGNNNHGNGSNKRQRTSGNNNNRTGSFNRKDPCKHCGKMHRQPDSKCWTLDKNKEDRPKNYTKGDSKKDKFQREVARQVEEQVSRQLSKATEAIKAHYSKKRSKSDDTTDLQANFATVNFKDKQDDSSVSSTSTSTTSSDYFESTYAFLERNRKIAKVKRHHYSPEIIVEIEDRNGDKVPIKCLLDTGTSASILLRQFVKRGRAKSYKGHKTVWNTMGGNFQTHRKALVDFKFPQLSDSKSVTWIVHIDETTDPKKSLYDMIIGMDLMTELGIYVNTEDKMIHWEGNVTPLVERGLYKDREMVHQLYHSAVNPIVMEAEERQARILDANYSKVDIEEYVNTLDYLNTEERQDLLALLLEFPILFGGGLGSLKIKPIHLELKPGVVPYHARPFPIPQSVHGTTKKEMDRLEGIRVFEKNNDSEWGAPTFVQKKKTGDVRILTDFRKLNDCIVRKPFPLPRIQDLLQKLRKFKYATAIDLSMGYYHIPLDEHSQRLCTTVLPWGKYRYRVLPMGIKNSPDIFQSIMQGILGDLEYALTYIDDILVVSDGSLEDHLAKVREVLKRLEKQDFRANVRKCFFAKPSLDYLGYLITREGIQPQPKKVEAMQRLQAPKNVRQLRHFLGMVNYYRDMWQKRSHILSPLTKLTGKGVPWNWGSKEQQAFEEIKKTCRDM